MTDAPPPLGFRYAGMLWFSGVMKKDHTDWLTNLPIAKKSTAYFPITNGKNRKNRMRRLAVMPESAEQLLRQ